MKVLTLIYFYKIWMDIQLLFSYLCVAFEAVMHKKRYQKTGKKNGDRLW